MFGFILKGGLLVWPIILCSVIAAAIVIERLYCFYRAKVDVPVLLASVKNLLINDQLNEAERLCRDSLSPVAHILAIVIRTHKRPSERNEKIITRVGSREIRGLEKNLRSLGIIAHISPLLGLLGTVTGIIKAFMKIQEFGGRVDASILAGGIWEALITTAAGLSVAIPAIIFYHYFEGRVDNFSNQMKDSAEELMEYLGVKESNSRTRHARSQEDIEYGV